MVLNVRPPMWLCLTSGRSSKRYKLDDQVLESFDVCRYGKDLQLKT